MNTSAVASYQQVTRPDLWNGRDGTFYRLTPVKGARVDGTVYVGMTSHETDDYSAGRPRPVKVDCPAMWVDLSPSLADTRQYGGRVISSVGSEREPITVNSKVYDARFGARVEFLPASKNDHRAQHYPLATVGGRVYLISARFDSWDGITDSARDVLRAVITAIAAEYVTDARWHAQRISSAEYQVSRRTEDCDKAQKELDAAVAELAAIRDNVNHRLPN
jgi:hypothetical protein